MCVDVNYSYDKLSVLKKQICGDTTQQREIKEFE